MLIAGFNQNSTSDNLIGSFFNYLIDMTSDDKANQDANEDDTEELLLLRNVDVADDVLHFFFLLFFFLWICKGVLSTL